MYKASVVFRQLGFVFIIHYRTVSVVLYYCLPKEAQMMRYVANPKGRKGKCITIMSPNGSLRGVLCKIDFTLLLYILETVTDINLQ